MQIFSKVLQQLPLPLHLLLDVVLNHSKMKILLGPTKLLISILLVSCFITNGYSQQDSIREEAMVKSFYTAQHDSLYWFKSKESLTKATDWLLLIESAETFGVMIDKAHSDNIRAALMSNKTIGEKYKAQRDRQITGAVLNFIKLLQEGTVHFDYDAVSEPRDSVYVNQLVNCELNEPVSQIVSNLECKDHDYLVMKKFLNDSIAAMDSIKLKKLVLAMNYRKYLFFNRSTDYVVVNIPETEAYYYGNNYLKLKMRAVVGRKDKPTPTIASYMTNIVTFPLWNVPHGIGVKEILPHVQKNDNYLEQNSYDVVNGKGKLVDESTVNWKSYNASNFPYFFRQSTGPRNAMGVIKFNLQNPFDVFLHSTSSPGLFAKDFRFLSHGCIRLEKPLELAKVLLPDKIDIKKLKGGKKNTVSETIKLPNKIPVFIIYQPVTVNGDKVAFLPDSYGLIK